MEAVRIYISIRLYHTTECALNDGVEVGIGVAQMMETLVTAMMTAQDKTVSRSKNRMKSSGTIYENRECFGSI